MFEFAAPWVFYLIPLPLISYYVLPSTRKQALNALKLPFFSALQVHHPRERRHLPQSVSLNRLLLVLIWILLLIALSGPRWLGQPLALPNAGRNIMLALDISRSMEIPDMTQGGRTTNRLQVVKAVAKEFIEKRAGDRLGLILFGTKAYLQTPLTFDRKTVIHMLDDATIGLAGPRTAMGDAIGLAIKRLRQTTGEDRVLILLTDGSSNAGALEPIQAAALAADEKIKIYTIGFGANRLVLPGLLGPQVINPTRDLDEATLKHIAKKTGGLFFRAANMHALAKVYREIDKLEPIIEDSQFYRPERNFYYWPLALALFLSCTMVLRQVYQRSRPA